MSRWCAGRGWRPANGCWCTAPPAASASPRSISASIWAPGSSPPASTETKRAFLKDYGADHVLPSSGFREAVKEITGGEGANVIYDPVGGDVFDESVRCIAFDGRIAIIGFTSGRIPQIGVNMPLIKGYSILGVRAGEYGRKFSEKGRQNMFAITKLLAEKKIHPHIHARFPLAQAVDAMRTLQDRSVIGKVVIETLDGALETGRDGRGAA
ncbi:MAG: zinc-binding dehydrogenase [Rhizomicrobium sp.]